MSRMLDEQWVDIVPPQAPPPSADPLTVTILAVVLLALLALGLYLHTRPHRRAKRALRRLARDLRHAQRDNKSVCLRIRACLRSGFRGRSLGTVRMAEPQQADWEAYLGRLSTSCFGPEPPTTGELNRLIDDASQWLGRRSVDA